MSESASSQASAAERSPGRASSTLTRFERGALALTRYANERPTPKRLQTSYVRSVTEFWVSRGISRRTLVDRVDPYVDYEPDRGVVLVSNHRSFFDMYIIMLGLYGSGAEWPKRLYFPVRSTFFYERAAGLAVNFGVGGGSMYPPIFRDRAKAELNKDSLARTTRLLQEPGTLVGLHPEGTRNKGDDPYTLLPAQPGIGQIIVASGATVIPIFVNGLSNDIARDVTLNFRPNGPREHPVVICFGDPIDYSDLAAMKPRPSVYKRTADRAREAIMELGERERRIRERCREGAYPREHPNWVRNRLAARKRR